MAWKIYGVVTLSEAGQALGSGPIPKVLRDRMAETGQQYAYLNIWTPVLKDGPPELVERRDALARICVAFSGATVWDRVVMLSHRSTIIKVDITEDVEVNPFLPLQGEMMDIYFGWSLQCQDGPRHIHTMLEAEAGSAQPVPIGYTEFVPMDLCMIRWIYTGVWTLYVGGLPEWYPIKAGNYDVDRTEWMLFRGPAK